MSKLFNWAAARLVAAFALALPLAAMATPTATAVWRSNLGQSYTIGGYTYAVSPNGGTLANGVITMGSAEQVLGATIDLPSGTRSVSVLVKFSGLALRENPYAGTALSAIIDANGNEVGAGKHKSDDGLRAYHVDTSSGRSSFDTAPETLSSGYMLFSYSASNGTRFYIGETIATLAGGTCGGAHYSNFDTAKVAIGGPATIKLMDTCPGFVIEDVALFTGSYLQASDVADYVFPTLNVDATTAMTMTALNTAVAAENSFNYYSASPVVTLDVAPSDATKAYLRGALWNGTVFIKDQNIVNLDPTIYGNKNSTLKLSGVSGHWGAAVYENTATPAIELEDSETEGREYGYYASNGYSFYSQGSYYYVHTPELKGSGTYKANTTGNGALFVADKFDNFTGKLNLEGKTVWLGTGAPTKSVDTWDNQVNFPGTVRLGGSIIPANYSTWNVPNGYKGTVEVAANDTANASSLFATNIWKGTVVVPASTNSTSGHIRIMLAKLGNANSVVQFNGLSSDTKDYYLNAGDSPTYDTTVDVNGWVEFANGSSSKTITFSKVIGSNAEATLRLAFPGTSTINYTITTLDQFAGTLSVNGYAPLTIGTINLAAAPDAGSKVVKCVNGSYIKSLASTKIAVNGVVDERYTGNLEQKADGIYVKKYAEITSADGETVTPYMNITNAFAAVQDDETLTLVGTAVTLNSDVTVAKSYTLAGDAQGTSVTGSGRFLLTGSAELTLGATVAVSNQIKWESADATVTFPTGSAPSSTRPMSGYLVYTRDNQDGTSTYYLEQSYWLYVGASNVTLTDYDSGAQLAMRNVVEGEVITFTATPLEGYGNLVVTANSEALTPVDDKYTVTVGAGNVTIQATAVEMRVITVPSVANATATAKIGDETVALDANGQASVPAGSEVKVTYAANEGYALSGQTEYTIDTATATTFVITDTATAKYVASITIGEATTKYTSLQAAVDEVAQNKDIVLLDNVVDGATVDREVTFNVVPGGYTYGDIVASGDFVLTTTALEGKTRYSLFQAVIAVTINEVRTLYTMMTANTGIETANAGPIGTTIEILVGNPADYAEYLPMFDLNTDTGVFTKVTDPVAAVYSGVVQVQVYRTLADAFAAAEAGQTVKLLVDVTLDSSLTIDKTLTLDLGGYTLTAANDSSKRIVVDGTATFQNGVIDGGTTVYDANNGTAMIRVNGNLTISADLTIRNTINAVAAFGTGTLTINGATINALGFAVSTNGKKTGPNASSGTTITINSGTITSSDVAVYLPSGTMTINGGSITGATGVYAKGGTLTIPSTSTVAVTATGANADWSYNPSGANTTGDAIVIDNSNYPYGPTEATIAGGTFTSQNADAIGNYTMNAETLPTATGFVSGGTFNTEVDETYCAEGYEPTDDGEGHYTVRVDLGWIYEAEDHPNYTGGWSNSVAYAEDHKIKIEDGNTYTANRPSAGQLVTVAMTLSFDDANDEEEAVGEAKAAIRLASGETSGTYQFQLYTSDGANMVWTNATATGVEAMTNVDYTIVFVLDLTNKVYTASIVDGATTNALSIGENVAEIPFAYQVEVTPVQQIDFVGAGKVTSITGSYEDVPAPVPAEEFQPDDEVTIDGDSVTLTSDQATWLNACSGIKAEKDAALLGLDATAFNNAYLLNLDITDPEYDGTFSFEVTDFTVGDAKVTVEVTLTRKGKLDGGINGTLKLTGTADLAAAFEDISATPVDDDDFSDGDTATWELTKGAAKFFLPVIE